MNAIVPAKVNFPAERAARREHILGLEAAVKRLPDVQSADDYVTRHHFAPGQYAREIELPAGSRVVGKIHKHAHINVISKGRVLVFTEHEGVLELRAPCTFTSSPGTKRVVMALWDTIWTTVHVTDKTDLAEIEAEIIADSYDDLVRLEHTKEATE